jgi:hypothetical protein
MPNSIGAQLEPSIGASNAWARSNSATSCWPAALKVAAARIRIEALMVSARHSAKVESMVESLIA